MAALDILLTLLLPTLILLHLLIAPYTKVEESFNIQATHDLIHFSPTTPLSAQFDHFTFPGAVPRTFVGASLLALLSKPFIYFLGSPHAVFYSQLVVRAVLGLLNVAALVRYKYGLEKEFGRDVARWWVLLLGGQFHVIFYASRTLPNMFAFGLTTLAFCECLPGNGPPNKKQREQHQRMAIYLFVLAGVIFRSEVALLLFTQLVYLLMQSKTSLRSIIPAGIKSAVLALGISVPIDSYLWQRPIWPELAGFYYNAIQGKSADWGTSPYGYYFTSLLPKLLLNPVILLIIPLSLILPSTKTPTRNLTIPSLLFITIYSLQPHKEARFIIYVVPPLTAAAALSASYIWTRRSKTLLYRLASLFLAASIICAFLASTAMLLISSLNYPGGEALSQLHAYIHSHPGSHREEIHIHMDVLSCMTGVTRFQQYSSREPLALSNIQHRETRIFYDKTEEEEVLGEPKFWGRFEYALMEEPGKAIGAWDVVGVVWAFAGVEILRPGDSPGGGNLEEKVYAANNLTTEMGEVRDSDDVRDAVQGVKIERKEKRVSFRNLKERLLSGEMGRYEVVTLVRDSVRLVTRGWWVGPKMEPKIQILKRVRDPIS